MEKLVRDLIPKIMEKKGQPTIYRIAESFEYEKKLLDKLLEEVYEFIANPSIGELVDVLEVIESIKFSKNFSEEKLEAIRLNKKRQTGGFKNKIILMSEEQK